MDSNVVEDRSTQEEGSVGGGAVPQLSLRLRPSLPAPKVTNPSNIQQVSKSQPSSSTALIKPIGVLAVLLSSCHSPQQFFWVRIATCYRILSLHYAKPCKRSVSSISSSRVVQNLYVAFKYMYTRLFTRISVINLYSTLRGNEPFAVVNVANSIVCHSHSTV